MIQPVSTEFIRMAELVRSSSAQVRVIMLSAAWGAARWGCRCGNVGLQVRRVKLQVRRGRV